MDPWGVSSLSLKLYEDPWTVKKVLTEDDTSNNNGLIAEDVIKMMLPVLGENAERDAQTADGVKLWFWDIDTEPSHQLLLKMDRKGCYRIRGQWNQGFNKRRNLKARDEIWLQWDRYNGRFNFSVIKRA